MASRPGIRNYRFSFNFYVTPAVQWLLIANVGIFFLEVLLRTFSQVSTYNWFILAFGLVPSGVTHGLRFWQPFTYLFLHDSSTIWHILTNMFMLFMFGRELELVWGRTRFLQYYFLTGVGAGLINVIVKTVPVFWGHPPSDVPTIGASGAIFGILLACAILFPDRQVTLFPISVILAACLWVMCICGAVLSFTTCATRSPTGSTNATANGSRSTSTSTEKSRPRDRTIGSTRSWRFEVRR